MDSKDLISTMLGLIESELQKHVEKIKNPTTTSFSDMLTYHMGWTGEGSGPEATGKRIRPLIVLLVTSACGASWQSALPGAASVELVHNFSLVHDDIQDNSDMRRGRTSLWKRWGIPMGINAGDALFVLSNQAILDLATKYPPEILVKVNKILFTACLHLTCGQYLDMLFEKQESVTIEEYWVMVQGKTAALFQACCEIGALLGRADDQTIKAYSDFGYYLGLAFQVQDDFLGIWGDPEKTGKSIATDLTTGKKSLPVLFGLEKDGKFARQWKIPELRLKNISKLADLLIEDGALLFTQETIDRMSDMAFQMLRLANPQSEAGEILFHILHNLQQRGT